MTLKETPSYIKTLVMPTAQKQQGRKVWSVDLENVWLPFFTATNTMGDTAIPVEALGAPLRLAYTKDGDVRFSASGRPVVRVAKEISDGVAMVRENFVANLMDYAEQVAEAKQKEYSAVVRSSEKAGKPIAEHDKANLDTAIQARIAAEMEAEMEAETEAETVHSPEAEKTEPEPALVS